MLEVFHRIAGEDGAVAVARERSGTQFAPNVVDAVANNNPGTLFAGLDEVTTWDTVIAPNPALPGC